MFSEANKLNNHVILRFLVHVIYFGYIDLMTGKAKRLLYLLAEGQAND